MTYPTVGATPYGKTEDTTGCFTDDLIELIQQYKSQHRERCCRSLAEDLRDLANDLEHNPRKSQVVTLPDVGTYVVVE